MKKHALQKWSSHQEYRLKKVCATLKHTGNYPPTFLTLGVSSFQHVI